MSGPIMKSFERLAQRGHSLAFALFSVEAWSEMIATDPEIPQTYEQLEVACRAMYARPAADAPLSAEECGMLEYTRFIRGLGNPGITEEQLAAIEDQIAAAVPQLNEKYEEGNVCIWYTTTDSDQRNNISLNEVKEIATALNKAWDVYYAGFDKVPYMYFPMYKILVNIYMLGGKTGYSAPTSPLLLDSRSMKESEILRMTTPAHELFHYIQFNYGMLQDNGWYPREPAAWFAEGSACWASAYVFSCVSFGDYVTQMYSDPRGSLLNSGNNAVPFWIECDMMTGLKNPCLTLRSMLESLQKSWTGRDMKFVDCFTLLRTLVKTIPDLGESMEDLFYRFNQDRRFHPCSCEGYIDKGPHKGETKCYYQLRDWQNKIVAPQCSLISENIDFGVRYELCNFDLNAWSLSGFRFGPTDDLRKDSAKRLARICITGSMAPGHVANFQPFHVFPNGNASATVNRLFTGEFEYSMTVKDDLASIDLLITCCDAPAGASQAILHSLKAYCEYV